MSCRRVFVGLGLILGISWGTGIGCGQPPEEPPRESSRAGEVGSGEISDAALSEESPPLAVEPADAGGYFSVTEVQFQYGHLESPSFVGGRSSDTKILTFQHASDWKYGDNFVFLDLLDDAVSDGFNDRDVYLEWYPNFSLGKILHRKLGWGPVSDVGLILGINYGADANLFKWLPGVRLAWTLPGFAFLNTDFTAYLDDSGGLGSGGAPAQTDSFMIDVNGALPFSIRNHDFSIEGHVEFIGGHRDELGNPVSEWVLAQPQFRYDLGKTLLDSPKKLFVGIEWQVWPNKVGDGFTDENAVQALVVWRL